MSGISIQRITELYDKPGRRWERNRPNLYRRPDGKATLEIYEPCTFAEALETAQIHREFIDMQDKMREKIALDKKRTKK